MKNLIKITALLLAFVAVLSFTGCSGKIDKKSLEFIADEDITAPYSLTSEDEYLEKTILTVGKYYDAENKCFYWFVGDKLCGMENEELSDITAPESIDFITKGAAKEAAADYFSKNFGKKSGYVFKDISYNESLNVYEATYVYKAGDFSSDDRLTIYVEHNRNISGFHAVKTGLYKDITEKTVSAHKSEVDALTETFREKLFGKIRRRRDIRNG